MGNARGECKHRLRFREEIGKWEVGSGKWKVGTGNERNTDQGCKGARVEMWIKEHEMPVWNEDLCLNSSIGKV
jgi:hypothetical protein